MSDRETDKPTFERKCPDCGKPFLVDNSYADDAYQAHARNEPFAVCQGCFDAFNGLTLEELLL